MSPTSKKGILKDFDESDSLLDTRTAQSLSEVDKAKSESTPFDEWDKDRFETQTFLGSKLTEVEKDNSFLPGLVDLSFQTAESSPSKPELGTDSLIVANESDDSVSTAVADEEDTFMDEMNDWVCDILSSREALQLAENIEKKLTEMVVSFKTQAEMSKDEKGNGVNSEKLSVEMDRAIENVVSFELTLDEKDRQVVVTEIDVKDDGKGIENIQDENVDKEETGVPAEGENWSEIENWLNSNLKLNAI